MENHAVTLKRRDLLFFVVFGLFSLTAWAWLSLGVAPLLAAASETLHTGFHARGGTDGVMAEVARNVGQAAHSATTSWQSVFDYVFSLFNLGLGLFLLKLRPNDVTARLLSIGMIGTAIAFNLQGHDALQVVPVDSLAVVNAWHIVIHVLSGLCYMFALLLFPSGRLRRKGRSRLLVLPWLVPVALFFTMLSLITADDHTLGLVIVYGVFIPVAGIAAQLGRFRRAQDPEQRQQSRVLLIALSFAILIAIPLVAFTQSLATSDSRTVTYEITAPASGTYFFRCDPHPVDMRGEVQVAPAGDRAAPAALEVTARNNRFDTAVLAMEGGRTAKIRFTNRDADLHNIALYTSEAADDPIFIGQEFSGRETAIVAFRVFRLVFIVIPIALFAGLIRFHLWDIDRVVNRTLVYGALAAIITLAYLALVVGLGTIFGAGTRMNLALSIVVTVVLAATFQPLRDRARRVANRIVYGKRATPYEVLSAFSERVGNSYAIEEAIPEMAKALGEGTHAKSAEVWLRVDDRLVRSAVWPEASVDHAPRSVAVQGDDLPALPDRDRTVRVAHRGEFLGALTVTKPAGHALTPVEERLLQDVAAQAGLVLRNAQLTAELQGRLDQLRESRQRIVAAQDAERRRLERNIHDGAQQHLVALSMKLRLAQELAEKEPERARALLEELQEDTGDALQTLRDLARGIYPPVLADKGLVQALEAHARRCPVQVTVSDRGVGRHPSDVEAAAYFCCLEAIQNGVKHAGDVPIEVEIEESGGFLWFRVVDRGPGFEPESAREGSGIQNMRDRVAALGGALDIASARDAGTHVQGRIPIPKLDPEPPSEVQATPN